MFKRSNVGARRRSLCALVLGSLTAFVVLLAFPLTSLADLSLGSTVSGIVNGVTNTVQTTVQNVVTATNNLTGAGSGESGTAAPSSTASAPATAVNHAASAVRRAASTPASSPASTSAASSTGYTPPMYGTNPHGQGTVSSVGLNPSSSVPYSYSPGGSSSSGEVLVLGRGRSEQNADGSYHAHTTIAALFGTELLGVDAQQGQSNTGPLNALQTGVLNQICSNLNELICLTVLAADTSASSNGANTHFAVAQLSSQQIAGLNASAATSDSGISTSGTCQSSYGDSSVANVALASGPLAGVSQSGESSQACTGQPPSQNANSSVVSLGGTGLGLPAAGCANGTPNTAFTPLAPLVAIYCNADDTSQAPVPSGVREALTVLGLQVGGTSLARVTTAASESHSVAPSTTTPGGGGGTGTGTGAGAGSGSGTGSGTTSSGGGKGSGNGHGNGSGTGSGNGNGSGSPGSSNKSSNNCTDADHDCGVGPNGAPEACVAGVDPDGDGDCVIGANRFAGQITAAKSASSLPFTGENVLEVILLGLILVGIGLTLSLRGKAPVPFRKRS